MTVSRDAESQHRNRCTASMSLGPLVIQCSSVFTDSEGRHRGPHHHQGFDNEARPYRLTWRNNRESIPPLPEPT